MVKSGIMYMEDKSGGLMRPACIGRVTFSRSGRTLYYAGREFRSLKGRGFKANYEDVATGDEFWISGPKKCGGDGLYGGNGAEIDEDVRVEYWVKIVACRRRRTPGSSIADNSVGEAANETPGCQSVLFLEGNGRRRRCVVGGSRKCEIVYSRGRRQSSMGWDRT
jgi:hypothetical protein